MKSGPRCNSVRRGYLASTLLVGVLCVATRPAGAQTIPSRLSDSTFWRMVTEFSEPGGFFRSDNFVSNEAAFQYVIPGLQRSLGTGGAYVGVGPDQNFTYLVALAPKIAFIVDIRRQNMLQHLLYKALLEMSSDRASFLSQLFSRARPAGLDTTARAASLFEAFAIVRPDSAMYRRTLSAMKARLTESHGFVLTADDLRSIEYVFGAFFAGGPDITYSFSTGMGSSGGFGFGMPSYAQLQMETDGQGQERAYLASESNYQALRDLEARNLVIPIVGDFAGEKALRQVASYLKDRGATVSAFYTSNVEQYLFQQGDEWSRFYTNVAMLPIDSMSVFIRSLSNRGWMVSQNPNSRSAQLVGSITELVSAFREGRVLQYRDVIALSHQ